MPSRTKYFVYMIVLAIACFFMYNFAEKIFSSPQPQSSSNSVAQVISKGASGQAKIGGAFELVDHEGKKRTEADYKGKITLVYFGYSFCPDICPTALYNITQALNDLGPKAKDLHVVFISIDPERDTPDQLAIYRKNFHPKIKMLTGSAAQVKAAAKAYRVYYQKATPDGTSTDYLLDHSSIVYVMDHQGRYVTSFNHETPGEKMAQILSGLL